MPTNDSDALAKAIAEQNRNQNEFNQRMVEALERLNQPRVDPKEEAQKEAARKARLASVKALQEREKGKQSICAHQEKDDGTGQLLWKINWMRNSDGVWRGLCTICSKTISPEKCEQDEYNRLVVQTLNYKKAGAAPLNFAAVENYRRAVEAKAATR